MTKTELQAKIDLYTRELNTLKSIPVRCNSCEHGASNGWCKLADCAPPPEVRNVGCDAWVFDEVPF